MAQHIINTSQPQREIQHRNPIQRHREDAHHWLMRDYFVERPVYPPDMFRRRIRMQKHVFQWIMDTLSSTDVFFEQRRDCTGKLGLSVQQKCSAAIRIIGNGCAADSVNEYPNVAESTAAECLTHFVDGIIANFKDCYMRQQCRGFPGMMGSIDCMHWTWKNCPKELQGQFRGRAKKATVILEAVASQDLWIWHAFFRTLGSCNDINILDRSPVFHNFCEGKAPEVNYMASRNQYHMGYYLTDGIYPKWAAFMPSITAPQTAKQRKFSRHQEGVRKDVERAFGVLQARFTIIQHGTLLDKVETINKIMLACIIMHNMIVEDERDTYLNYIDPTLFIEDRAATSSAEDYMESSTNRIASLEAYMRRRSEVRAMMSIKI